MRLVHWWWSVANKASFTWTSDTITPKMKQAFSRATQYLTRMTAYYSLRGESYAKSKAKWKDRTGNARSGLSSSYEAHLAESSTFTIDIYHRVPYGIWLEVRFNQKYAIINKTIEKTGKDFIQASNNLLARMFGGE